ncbi:SMI1/KNR4 family protein [Mesobacillus zeae]|uniref:SMI1/KNR4 family protein n=1 Tax=Mesobacillus zeae TaxID=1917180 RepID=A0A398B4U7_9BACI|nr:SMI1/KNR4 family protein [Mesobacillus zeae]RID84935.1 SMI1/KNR4 family protein [Mesobacillus zeae]
MDEQIKALLSQFELNEPASEIDIKKVEELLSVNFPQEYYDFLLISNGGEGAIGQSYLVLWKIEDLIDLNDAYGVEEFAPGLLIIGSDGGDTAYCIDIKSEIKPFVQVPFIGMDLSEVQSCSNDFKGFLSFLDKE